MTRSTYKFQPGDVFNFLTILGKGPTINRSLLWICRCICGVEICNLMKNNYSLKNLLNRIKTIHEMAVKRGDL